MQTHQLNRLTCLLFLSHRDQWTQWYSSTMICNCLLKVTWSKFLHFGNIPHTEFWRSVRRRSEVKKAAGGSQQTPRWITDSKQTPRDDQLSRQDQTQRAGFRETTYWYCQQKSKLRGTSAADTKHEQFCTKSHPTVIRTGAVNNRSGYFPLMIPSVLQRKKDLV